ncbi:putative GrpE nucleotide exchange factor [Tanacetum coccineum]|uniref:GrpE nucleotide exchange factor n=1 Tax=Tanacetum coccineum TaxID=301880 RepID=A0ABQ4Z2A5_9ASTR
MILSCYTMYGTLIALASFSKGKKIDKMKYAALLSPLAYLSHMTIALGILGAKIFIGEVYDMRFELNEVEARSEHYPSTISFLNLLNSLIAEERDATDRGRSFDLTSGFAKGLLDVADNLDRASSVVKESFAKLDTSSDSSGAVPLLKTLLEGVKMTEKQLADVKSFCNYSK